MENTHKSVMLGEVIKNIPSKDAHLNTQVKVIDATLGLAGYTRKLCEMGLKVLGIEADFTMLERAKRRLGSACPANLLHGNFRDIAKIAKENNFSKVQAVIFDLGVSSPQLISQTRGFSFQNLNAVLDMRLDPKTQGVTAYDLLNSLNHRSLREMFERVLTYKESQNLSKKVVEARREKPIKTVGDFLSILKGTVKLNLGINPATRPFLALRMAVNSEIENLETGLDGALSVLGDSGRIIVVSFHSLEDATVKKKFKDFEKIGLGKILTKKPILPSTKEVEINPRARSAKLRIFEKNETFKTRKEN